MMNFTVSIRLCTVFRICYRKGAVKCAAIRLLQAERHEDIQHLHKQLVTGGILQKELLEEAESYLIQKDIYDVTLIEECDFREYKKLLIDSGRYTRQSAVERSSALRKIQRYWVEQEYGELIAEVKECQVSDAPLKGNIQRFLDPAGNPPYQRYRLYRAEPI